MYTCTYTHAHTHTHTESSLDRPYRKRASTIVKKLQETIKQGESDGRLLEEEPDSAGEETLLDEKSEGRKVDSIEEGENKVDFEQTGEAVIQTRLSASLVPRLTPTLRLVEC